MLGKPPKASNRKRNVYKLSLDSVACVVTLYPDRPMVLCHVREKVKLNKVSLGCILAHCGTAQIARTVNKTFLIYFALLIVLQLCDSVISTEKPAKTRGNEKKEKTSSEIKAIPLGFKSILLSFSRLCSDAAQVSVSRQKGRIPWPEGNLSISQKLQL